MEQAGQNPNVDFYFDKTEKWREELRLLRKTVLGCGLAEELKWGVPCYTFQKHNIVLLHEFKEYCAVLFIKGALLHDSEGILVQQTKNVQAARQMRFTGTAEIMKLQAHLKAYIREAVELEKAGLKVEWKQTAAFEMPAEFQHKLDEMPALKTAFEALSPGRQRAYLLHFSAPKQVKTRESRIENRLQQILHGKGLDD